MSITRHLAELLLAEHKRRPIKGEVLLLGRQAIWMTPSEAEALVGRMGIERPPGAFIEVGKIPHPYGKDLISDVSFFSLFTDAAIKACDVSDHEQADFIFNLADGVPDALLDRFDFIYNGSVLDNVFDPVACIQNVTRMLKPRGLVYGYEGIAHSGAAYLKFSPEWFFDYYALNGFADVQAYVATCDDFHKSTYDVYEWSAFTESGVLAKPMQMTKDAIIAVFAEKSPTATWDKSPIQGVYRSNEHQVYREACLRYAASDRRATIAELFPPQAALPSSPAPAFWKRFGQKKATPAAALADGHRYLGRLGSPDFLGD